MAWVPLGYRRIGALNDRHPFIGLGRLPLLRDLAINRYVLPRQRVSRQACTPRFADLYFSRSAGSFTSLKACFMIRSSEYPSVELCVGVHVWRRNVAVRPDDRQDLRRVASREPFLFAGRHLLGIGNETFAQ